MKIRFQADADLNEDIVTGVRRREPRMDFRTAAEAGLRGLTDERVLQLAAEDGRILVTHDRRTMPREFAAFIATQRSPGVAILSQRTSVLDAIEDIILIWTASEMEEWTNTVLTIPL